MGNTHIRMKFTKCNNSKYISHLDLMRLFQRAFRRAGLHLKHTEGFNPQPKLAFATALSLGTTSEGEYLDAELEEGIDLLPFKQTINSVLPDGVVVLDANYRTDKESIASLIRYGTYIVEVTLQDDLSKEELEEKFEKYLSLEEIMVTKKKKKRGRMVIKESNIRELIISLDILMYEDKKVTFKTTLVTGSNGNLKPELLLETMERYVELRVDERETHIHRLDLYVEQDGEMASPL